MDVSEVRRRLRGAMEQARRDTAERRRRADEAGRDYERFLKRHAVPIFHTFAAALTAEGRRFTVFTPAGSVRLASDASGEDFIELSLDASQDPPRVLGRTSRGRGRRMVTTERPLDPAVADLTDEDVLEFLLAEIGPFVGR